MVMTQLPLNASASASRLLRFLSDWVDGDVATATPGFAERLGQLFDLPDSIRISSAHGKISSDHFEPSTLSTDAVRDEFFRVRTSLIRSSLSRFAPGSRHTRNRFPVTDIAAPADEATDPEPYLAFYAALQRDIDFRSRNLQAALRESVAGFSPSLAQLCALDGALAAPLAAHNRRLFAAVPKLLQTRFELLLAEYRETTPPGEHAPELWVNTLKVLRNDMQGLLLAEIETRLLPSLGLIEALDEHTQR
jgi:hypothetical protein